MSCCCKCNEIVKVTASSVTLTDGVSTVTIPSTVTPADGTVYKIYLRTSIPSGTDFSQISITNGTVTANVMNHSANYFRPYVLKGWMVLTVRYLSDPSHFLIERIGKC